MKGKDKKGTGTEQDPYRILLIDDELLLIKILGELIQDKMKAKGFFVKTELAQNPAEAFRFVATNVREREYNLAICDFHLGNMTGLQCLGDIKKLQPNIKTMLLTTAEQDFFQEPLAGGLLNAFVSKNSLPGSGYDKLVDLILKLIN